MSSVLLLLAEQTSEGVAIPINTQLFDGVRSNNWQAASALSVRLQHNSPEALSSAQKGARVAFDLLCREGYLARTLMVRYQLPDAPKNIMGHSGDIAYALALITAHFRRQVFPAIAATGVLALNGSIEAVEHIPQKLLAALKILPVGSIIFLPVGNRAHVPPQLPTFCDKHRIRLHFIAGLEEACALLGIEVRQYFRGNPFRGLQAFGLEHAALFFGRGPQIDAACQQLKQRYQQGNPSLLVIGASGSGKSSFVQAGILNELVYGSVLPDDMQIRHSVFQPRQLQDQGSTQATGGLSERLANTLQAHWATALQVEIANFGTDIASAVQACRQAIDAVIRPAPTHSNLYVWIIDQLEELFTLGWDKHEQQAFLELLVALPAHGIWVIATLRSDFYANYQQTPCLLQHFRSNGQYDLLPPDQAALGAVIREPARLAGLHFESRGDINLADRILSDCHYQSTALPLLEFALSQLYEMRDKTRQLLSHATYESMGMVQGAIGTWATKVYGSLPAEQQASAYLQTLVRHLTVVELSPQAQYQGMIGYRITARTVALNSLPSAVLPLVRSLAQAHLLVLGQDSQGDVQVRVTHEALLHNWPQVQAQIVQDQQQLILLQQLARECQHWQQAIAADKADFLIPEGSRLRQALSLRKQWGETLPVDIGLYIKASQRQVTRRKQRWWLGSVLALLLLITGMLFYWVGYSKPTVDYYADFTRHYAVPAAKGKPLTAQERSKNNKQYELTRQGWFGPITRIRSLDQYGQCTAEEKMALRTWVGTHKQDDCGCDLRICEIDFTYDGTGQLTQETGLGPSAQTVFTFSYLSRELGQYVGWNALQPKSDATHVEFSWDRNGYATDLRLWNGVRKATTDEYGVHHYHYRYDVAGNELERRYFGSAEKPMLKDQHHQWRRAYNEQGKVIEAAYFDTQAKPLLHKDGYHLWRARYDEHGNQLEETYFGLQNEPVLHQDNYQRWNARYDEYGNQLEKSYFGLQGEAVLLRGTGYHLVHSQFDANGNEIDLSYFGLQGEPVVNNVGYHYWRRKYDVHGNVIESAVFGLRGEPVLDGNTGHHIARTLYDERGNALEWSYFGLKSEPVLHREGYHRLQNKYDAHNNRVEALMYGLKGEPAIHNDGYHRWQYTYNANGSLIARRYFGLNNQPVFSQENTPLSTRTYDERGNMTGEAFFAKEGKPVLGKEGNHFWQGKFDERGNKIESARFGIKGEPVLYKEGYHLWRASFDERGNQLESTTFGFEGEPVIDNAGSYLFRKKYDEYNNGVEEAYFGVKGEPVLDKEGVYHLWQGKYDTQGYKIEGHYFGINNEPVLNKEGYHYWRKRFDTRGYVLEALYFGVKNEPVLDENGCHHSVFKYDGQGNQVEFRCLGLKNEPVLDKEGKHIIRRAYDSYNRELEERMFGIDDQPVLNLFKFHKNNDEYDTRGNLLKLSFTGLQHEPAISSSAGYASREMRYDAYGNEIERIHRGLDGQLILGHFTDDTQDFAIRRQAYDSYGHLVEQSYFGADGKPMLGKEGYHRWHKRYDPQGHELEVAYFGLDNQPVYHRQKGYHLSRTTYDDYGNKIEGTSFGLQGEPIEDAFLNHRFRSRYDVWGNRVEETYFDRHDQPVLVKLGYQRVYYRYDIYGREVECIHYGLEGKPVMSTFEDGQQNFAIRRRTYNPYGHAVSEVLLDPEQKPLPKLKTSKATKH